MTNDVTAAIMGGLLIVSMLLFTIIAVLATGLRKHYRLIEDLQWKLRTAKNEIHALQDGQTTLNLSVLQALPARDPRTGRFVRRQAP